MMTRRPTDDDDWLYRVGDRVVLKDGRYAVVVQRDAGGVTVMHGGVRERVSVFAIVPGRRW